jgi:ribosome-binding factor A
MPSPRLRRVGELIKRELAIYLTTRARSFNSYLFTVTDVVPARDLRSATVWVSIYGGDASQVKGLDLLKIKSKEIRFELANRIYLKRMPSLFFKLDDSLDRADKIDKTLMSTGHFVSPRVNDTEDDE